MRLRLPLLALMSGASLALGAAPAAAAGAITSSNWAGYAVHGKGARFARVLGAWTQPNASCVPGQATYSAVWVGLGGYSLNADALEQIGTEVDCTAAGRVSSSAWIELVPAASRTLSLSVSPGDAIVASVSVEGHRATLALRDVTDRRGFKRTLNAKYLDVSSAEWIVEAPSDCISAANCQTLPLADFGTVPIQLAQATTSSGHTGTITDRHWNTTAIRLLPGSPHAVLAAAGASVGGALPSPLSAHGSAFSVSYASTPAAGPPPVVADIARRVGG